MQSRERLESALVAARLRSIIRVRWLGVAFALAQVALYPNPYPPGLEATAVGLVAAVAVTNVVFEVLYRGRVRPGLVDGTGLALAVLVVDVLVMSALTWVYAFDSLSALFAILFLLPIEAAVVFSLQGALWTWGAVAVLYLGREWFGTRYGNPFELDSFTFRVGLIGLVALFVGMIVRDLVAQRRATTEALHEAERSEASLTALIRVLAHDVRAPIAGARTAFDMLASAGDRLSRDQAAQVVEVGRRQADRALLLARDLLDLARAEAGTLSIDLQDVPVADALVGVGGALGAAAPTTVEAGGAVVRADPVRLEQVLFNLLDNAAKYGEPPVEVTAQRLGEWVELRIRDHGPGIPEGVELFTPFSRAGEGSVGLGMWIVRQLVEAMHGTVRHEPADPGACFVVRLPSA